MKIKNQTLETYLLTVSFNQLKGTRIIETESFAFIEGMEKEKVLNRTKKYDINTPMMDAKFNIYLCTTKGKRRKKTLLESHPIDKEDFNNILKHIQKISQIKAYQRL